MEMLLANPPPEEAEGAGVDEPEDGAGCCALVGEQVLQPPLPDRIVSVTVALSPLQPELLQACT